MDLISDMVTLWIALFLMWALINRGIPVFQELVRDMTGFFMEKALGPCADLFEGRAGSGSLAWMMHGMLWFCIGGTFSFVGLWMGHEPDAIASLGAIYYSPSAATVSAVGGATLSGALFMLIAGAGLHVNGRLSGGGIASEVNAVLVAWAMSTAMLIGLIAGHLSSGTFADYMGIAVDVLGFAVLLALVANHLLTIGEGEGAMHPSQWLIVLGLLMAVVAVACEFFGCLGTGALQSLEGLAILSGALAVAFYVVPSEAGAPLWSRSLAGATVLLTFVSLSPIGVSGGAMSQGGASFLTILYTASLIPILAAAMNVFQTARSNWGAASQSPASSAAMLGMFLLVGAAIGSLFTGADAWAAGDIAHLQGSMGMLATGAFAMIALGGVMAAFPDAAGRSLHSGETSRMVVWMVGVPITLAFLFGLAAAMLDASLDAAIAANAWDADLVDKSAVGDLLTLGSIAFYLVVIAGIMMMLNMIRGMFSGAPVRAEGPAGLAANRMALTPGSTTIRQLLAAGAGADTEIDVICDACGDEEE